MAKASIPLPTGKIAKIEGTPEEINAILEFYYKISTPQTKSPNHVGSKKLASVTSTIDSIGIVNKIHECDEAEAIENTILRGNSQLDRSLLPLYIVHKYFDPETALKSSEISSILARLNIKIEPANISKAFRLNSKYLFKDNSNSKESARFRLNRRGIEYIESRISEPTKVVKRQSKPKSTPKPRKRSSPSKESYSIVNNLELGADHGHAGLSEFYKGFVYNSFSERNVVFVYFLRKLCGMTDVSLDHIYTCYKFVNTPLPEKFKQSLLDTSSKKKWLDTSSMNDIKLTLIGENFVEHNLEKAT